MRFLTENDKYDNTLHTSMVDMILHAYTSESNMTFNPLKGKITMKAHIIQLITLRSQN